jgi:MFS family permease
MGGTIVATGTGGGSASRAYLLAVLTALTAFNQLDRALMNILLEPVRREFALSDVQLGLLSGFSFAAVYTACSIPAAVWAVRHDRRNLIAAAALLWGAMTALCGAAHTFWLLLLGRIGVGIGEAGGPAPSHAMLSDLYPSGERGSAIATYTVGINVGVILAFLIGGVGGQLFGWRAAFVSAGVMTMLLALLFRFTVRDPPRMPDARGREIGDAGSIALVRQTVRAMAGDPAMRHVCIGAVLATTVGYTAAAWVPSYLARSHGLSLGTIGIYLAAVVGVGGACGTYAGGRLSDALGRRDVRWSLWLFAVMFMVVTPLAIAFYLANGTALALLLFVVPALVGVVYLGPSVAVLHDRVPAALRPIASAMFILLVTLVGLGAGPLLAGALSQYVFAAHGEDSLRYALALMQLAALWSAAHYYVAGGQLQRSPVG